LIRWTV